MAIICEQSFQGDGAIINMLSMFSYVEVLGDAGEAVADLKQLFSLVDKFGYSEWIQFDASIVRGLAYYTGIVFEVRISMCFPS